MSRHAKSGISIEELKRHIDDAGGMYEVVNTPKIVSDLKKIEFDTENVTDPDDDEGGFCMDGFTHGYEMLDNGVPVCWVGAGGDWEFPLAFCVYLDTDNTLRAYIPKDGNVYNFKTKRALGNEPDPTDSNGWSNMSFKDEKAHFGIPDEFDMAKLRADACNRIKTI